MDGQEFPMPNSNRLPLHSIDQSWIEKIKGSLKKKKSSYQGTGTDTWLSSLNQHGFKMIHIFCAFTSFVFSGTLLQIPLILSAFD